MKNFILIVSSIFIFVSCTSNEGVVNSSIKSKVKEKKQGSKMFGEITTQAPKMLKSKGLRTNNMELFFKSADDYYKIIITKSDVSEQKMLNELNKPLKIWADIIPLNNKTYTSLNELESKGAKGFVIIYKMFPEK